MIYPEYNSERIRVCGKHIQTYTFGQGRKIVLALPSFPHSGLYFRWLFLHQALPEFCFVVLDLPGWIGESDGYEKGEPYSIGRVIETIKAVVRHYSSAPFSILGYSFGAALALKLAADWPKKVNKIILVSPIIKTIGLKNKDILYIKACKKLGWGWPVKWHILRMFKRYCSELATIEEGKLLREGGWLDNYRRQIKDSDSRILLESIYLMFHLDWSKYLTVLQNKQVLVVSSRNENKMFKEQAEMIRRKLDNEESMHIHGSHTDFLIKPNDKVIKQILNFLKK